jgi:ribosomal protein S18 acetylase RimI-like enzyme
VTLGKLADLPEVGSVSIRRAVSGDVNSLVVIEEAAFRSDIVSARSFKRLIASKTADVLIAEDASQVKGYALVLYRAKASVGRIYSIAVDPGSLRMGIGSLLLQAAEQACVHRGMSRVRLEVEEGNLAAISIYRRFGYRPTGRTEKYYESGAHALRFEKWLNR